MIDLSSTRKIRIEGVNGRNGINWEPGTIWSHVWNLVCTLNQEPMGCEFSECRLAYMDGDVPVFVIEPIKCSNSEIVNISHEIYLDVFLE